MIYYQAFEHVGGYFFLCQHLQMMRTSPLVEILTDWREILVPGLQAKNVYQ